MAEGDQFVTGTMVRVRLQSECRGKLIPGSYLHGKGHRQHPAWVDGLTGRVLSPLDPTINETGLAGYREVHVPTGHTILVMFPGKPGPYVDYPHNTWNMAFAPNELELAPASR